MLPRPRIANVVRAGHPGPRRLEELLVGATLDSIHQGFETRHGGPLVPVGGDAVEEAVFINLAGAENDGRLLHHLGRVGDHEAGGGAELPLAVLWFPARRILSPAVKAEEVHEVAEALQALGRGVFPLEEKEGVVAVNVPPLEPRVDSPILDAKVGHDQAVAQGGVHVPRRSNPVREVGAARHRAHHAVEERLAHVRLTAPECLEKGSFSLGESVDVRIEVGHIHPNRVAPLSQVLCDVSEPLGVVPALGESPGPIRADGIFVEPVLERDHLRGQANGPPRVIGRYQPDGLVLVWGVEEHLPLPERPVVGVRLIGVLYCAAVLAPFARYEVGRVVHQAIRVVLVPGPRPRVKHPDVLLGVHSPRRDHRRGEGGCPGTKHDICGVRSGQVRSTSRKTRSQIDEGGVDGPGRPGTNQPGRQRKVAPDPTLGRQRDSAGFPQGGDKAVLPHVGVRGYAAHEVSVAPRDLALDTSGLHLEPLPVCGEVHPWVVAWNPDVVPWASPVAAGFEGHPGHGVNSGTGEKLGVHSRL